MKLEIQLINDFSLIQKHICFDTVGPCNFMASWIFQYNKNLIRPLAVERDESEEDDPDSGTTACPE